MAVLIITSFLVRGQYNDIKGIIYILKMSFILQENRVTSSILSTLPTRDILPCHIFHNGCIDVMKKDF